MACTPWTRHGALGLGLIVGLVGLLIWGPEAALAQRASRARKPKPAAEKPRGEKPRETAGGKEKTPKDVGSGTLRIGEKSYELKHAVAYESLLFDEPVLAVMLSSKRIELAELKESLAEDGTDNRFFPGEPYVTVKFKDGAAYSCNAWADNFSLSIIGSSLSGEAKLEDRRVTGEAKLEVDPEDEPERQQEFKVKFDLAVLDAPAPAKKKRPDSDGLAADDEIPGGLGLDEEMPDVGELEGVPGLSGLRKLLGEAAGEVDKAAEEIDRAADEIDAALGGAAPNARELPRPDDATDVEYKEVVGHIRYRSATKHKALAKWLAKELAKQGWEGDGNDLIADASAILRRKRDAAELTIFVKPAGKGSTVQVMTEGLNWDEPSEDPTTDEDDGETGDTPRGTVESADGESSEGDE